MKIHSKDHQKIITSLKNNQVIYMPTDTIPGLVAMANSLIAVEEIFKLKGRDHNKPPVILISSLIQLDELGVILSDKQENIISDYWPGPVSIILQTSLGANGEYLHRGKHDLAIRLTNRPDIVPIIDSVGPLATSSANMQGSSPAASPDEARAYFGDRIKLYVDHSPFEQMRPSTIVRVDQSGRATIIPRG